MAYAIKLDGKVVPLTGMIDPNVLIDGGRNTIVYEAGPRHPRQHLQALLHQPLAAIAAPATLRELLCCLPQVLAPDELGYENLFRILIMQFIDAHSFDVRSVKKTCVHIAHPDGRLIPFDTYNMFYRDNLEKTILKPLRQNAELSLAAI